MKNCKIKTEPKQSREGWINKNWES